MMAAVRRPVVVVLGATGTGKSKLAIELGRHFNGEIISADSMQMYKSLDIITNKVTAEEQAQCPHHLLSVLNPLSANNTVTHFRDMALPIIDRLLEAGKVPIIVGGTNYYIEALIWNFLVDKQMVDLAHKMNNASILPLGKAESDVSTIQTVSASSGEPNLAQDEDSHSDHSSDDEADTPGEGCPSKSGTSISEARREKEGKYAGFESEELHRMLEKVDPETAQRLHPKNRRKVVRALQVYDDYGVPMSQVHEAQHKSGNTPGLSGALRYDHCCVFWLRTETPVLDKRLDGRVVDMLKNGLLEELHELHQHYLTSVAANNGEPDYTLGIFQSIGFKEFHDYLLLPSDKRESPQGRQLFEQGVEDLKTATRQYARRQLKWIRNRFLKRPGDNVPPVYGLDSTDVSQWSHNVFQPAVDVLSAVIEDKEVPVKPLSPDSEPQTVHVHNVCDVCDGRIFTTLHEWQIHLVSRNHQRMAQRKRKMERRLLERQARTETSTADNDERKQNS